MSYEEQEEPVLAEDVWMAALTAAIKSGSLAPGHIADSTLAEYRLRFRVNDVNCLI